MPNTVKRRLRVAASIAPVFMVTGLALWLGPKLRREPIHSFANEATLLILVQRHTPRGLSDGQQLVRVAFKNGHPQPAEVVCEWKPPIFNYASQCRIIDNRYVVTTFGGVIDSSEKEIIHKGNRELIKANAERVISGIRVLGRPQEIVVFNLQTRKVEKLTDQDLEPFTLPGIRSPDGIKSVEVDGTSLTLHRVGHSSTQLGSEFLVNQIGNPPKRDNVPVLWLDDERFLTQRGNGNLIAVSQDGRCDPVVKVPPKPESVGAPLLFHNLDGRIIYECDLNGFFIDVTAKTWERCEWLSLGHGFDSSWLPDRRGRCVLRYGQEEIGETPNCLRPFGPSYTKDGSIAISDDNRQIQVWFTSTNKWTTLDISNATPIGWIK